jgi:hypothetical protein
MRFKASSSALGGAVLKDIPGNIWAEAAADATIKTIKASAQDLIITLSPL